MAKGIYSTLRDFHLYLGLFLSPFLLVFAVSAVFLVHAWLPGSTREPIRTEVTGVSLPVGVEELKGRAQLDAIRPALELLGVKGEIWNIRQYPKARRIEVEVDVPGWRTTVDFNRSTNTTAMVRKPTGLADAIVYLHKTPGPHLVALRGNSTFMAVWRILADVTTYGLLFISLSGVYLWVVLRAERRIGIGLLAAGAATLGGLIYALVN